MKEIKMKKVLILIIVCSLALPILGRTELPLDKLALYMSFDNVSGDTVKDESKHGNKYVYLYANEGTYKPTRVVITFNVKRNEHQNELYEHINPQNYLGAYSRVPTGEVFQKIIDENKLSKDNIRGVYDFVLSGMHYGKPKSIDNKYYKDPWLREGEKYGMKGVTRDQVVEKYQ